MEDKYTLEEFAQMIKAKYPQYEDLDNLDLANRMLEKYPVYQDMIVKKKDSSESLSQNPFMAFMPDSEVASTDLDFTQVTNPNPEAEKNFIGGSFGEFVNSIPVVGDFIDDTARAIYTGQGEGAKIDETLKLMYGGTDVDRETVQTYVDTVKDWQRQQESVGMSDEMRSFNKIYEENGSGPFGFFKGLANNPSVIPEIFLQSMAGMANKVSVAEGAAIMGGGAVAGSVAPGVGTAAGIAATMPTALGVMGGTLETAASFSEFLNEELGEREFNVDNVLAVMQDPEAYARMRNKALTRGATIGVFDAIGGRLVRSVGGNVLAKTGSKLKTTGVGLAGEAVSGAVGETAARVAVGQELDVAEIGFEGVAGLATAPISVGTVLLNPPKYSVNNGAANRNEVLDVVNTATNEQIKAGLLDKIEVKNDAEVSALIASKKRKAEIDAEIDPRVKGEDRARLVELETEREKYVNSKLKSGKNRLSEIDSEIDEITNRAVEEAKVEPIEPKQPEPIEAQPEPTSQKLDLSEYDLVKDISSGDRYRKIERGAGPEGTSVYVKEGTDVYRDADGVLRPSADEQFAMAGETIGDKLMDLVEEGKPKEAPVQPEAVETPEEAEIKITEGKVGDTFTSNRGEEKVVIKTKKQTVTQSTTETVNPAEQRRFGLKSVTDAYREVYGDKMDGTEPVQKLNVYPEKSLATGKKVTQQAEPTEAPAQPEAPEQPKQEYPTWRFDEEALLQRSQPKSQMSRLKKLFHRKRRDITLNGVPYDKFSLNRAAKKLWNRTFKSNAGLNNEVAETYRQLNRDIAAYNDKINVEANAINDLRKKAGKGADDNLRNSRYDRINAYLTGDKDADLSFLDQKDIEVLDYSRARIDTLSKHIVNVLNQKMQETKMTEAQKEATQQLIETIQFNEGQYIKRTYQAFTDPKYLEGFMMPYGDMNEVARKKFDGAVEYLQAAEGLSFDEAQAEVVKYIDGLARNSGSEMAVGKAGAAAARFLKQRKDIPEAFRDLLGEAKDPLYNYANTTEQLSGFLASIDYQQNLADTILGMGIATDQPKPGYTKLSPNSSDWSYLKDLYVPVEFKEAMESLGPLETLNDNFYKTFVNLTSLGKLSKTVLSPTTTFRNLYSGILLGLNSGHLFAMSPDKIGKSAAMAWGPVRDKKQLQAEREQLIRLGIIGDAARSGELMATLNDFGSYFGDPAKQGAGKRVIDFAKQAYAFGDDFYKTVGFYQEKAKLMDSGMNEVDATNKAAERIRGGYPTYSYIPPNIRKLRRNPFLGSFVSFPYEVVRTTKNNLLYAAEDFKAGRNKMAMSRLAGMTMATTGIAAISTASKQMLGLSDEDDERIRSLVPFYQEDSELLYMGKDENSATFIDGTALFPSEVVVKPIRILLENPQDETVGKRAVDALEEALGPYVGFDLTSKALLELFKNENSFGNAIYSEGEKVSSIPIVNGVFNDPKAMVNYLAKKAGPGVYNNAQEMARALEISPEIFGEKVSTYREYNPEDALLGFLGFRQSTVNYYQAVKNKIREEKDIMSELQAQQLKSLSSNRIMSDDEIQKAFSAYKQAQDKFNNTVLGYAETGRTLGMAEDKIGSSFSDGGMSRRDVAQTLGGGAIPMRIVSKQRYTDKIDALRANKAIYGDQRVQEMIDMYTANVEAFNALVQAQEQ